MALVCTLKETLSKAGYWASIGADGPSYSWTAFTPAANTLLVAIFGANDNGSETDLMQNEISSVTGGGLTWTKLTYADDAAQYKARSVIYYAEVGASPASTTVTITFTGTGDIGQISASIWECSGYDTSSPLGGKAALANQASNGAVTMTLDATPASGSVVLRHIHRSCDPGGGTFDTDLGTGFTEDGVSNQDSVYVWSQGSQRGSSTSTAVGFDDVQTGSATTTNYETAMAAVEVKAAAGGGGGASVTPSTLALTTTGNAPTVTASDHKSVTPSTLALVTALFAATVTATANQLVTPSTLAQVLSLFAATVSATANQTATPSTLALTTTGNAPTVSASGNQSVTPATLALVLSLLTPTVTAGGNQSVTPSTLALVLSLFAATVQTPVTVTPSTLALALNANAPTVQTPVTVTPTTGALVVATFAPVVAATANQLVTVTTLAMTLALFAPTVTGDAVSVIGRMLLHDEATARAILNDARVNTALLRDELVWLAEARD